MNIPRIINYLIKKGYISNNPDSSELVSKLLQVSFNDFLVDINKLLLKGITDVVHKDLFQSLSKFALMLLTKGISIPLDGDPHNNYLLKIDHDLENDDLDLGSLLVPGKYIDWEHSYEDHNIKLTREGINYVCDQLYHARYYPGLRFSLVREMSSYCD